MMTISLKVTSGVENAQVGTRAAALLSSLFINAIFSSLFLIIWSACLFLPLSWVRSFPFGISTLVSCLSEILASPRKRADNNTSTIIDAFTTKVEDFEELVRIAGYYGYNVSEVCREPAKAIRTTALLSLGLSLPFLMDHINTHLKQSAEARQKWTMKVEKKFSAAAFKERVTKYIGKYNPSSSWPDDDSLDAEIDAFLRAIPEPATASHKTSHSEALIDIKRNSIASSNVTNGDSQICKIRLLAKLKSDSIDFAEDFSDCLINPSKNPTIEFWNSAIPALLSNISKTHSEILLSLDADDTEPVDSDTTDSWSPRVPTKEECDDFAADVVECDTPEFSVSDHTARSVLSGLDNDSFAKRLCSTSMMYQSALKSHPDLDKIIETSKEDPTFLCDVRSKLVRFTDRSFSVLFNEIRRIFDTTATPIRIGFLVLLKLAIFAPYILVVALAQVTVTAQTASLLQIPLRMRISGKTTVRRDFSYSKSDGTTGFGYQIFEANNPSLPVNYGDAYESLEGYTLLYCISGALTTFGEEIPTQGRTTMSWPDYKKKLYSFQGDSGWDRVSSSDAGISCIAHSKFIEETISGDTYINYGVLQASECPFTASVFSLVVGVKKTDTPKFYRVFELQKNDDLLPTVTVRTHINNISFVTTAEVSQTATAKRKFDFEDCKYLVQDISRDAFFCTDSTVVHTALEAPADVKKFRVRYALGTIPQINGCRNPSSSQITARANDGLLKMSWTSLKNICKITSIVEPYPTEPRLNDGYKTLELSEVDFPSDQASATLLSYGFPITLKSESLQSCSAQPTWEIPSVRALKEAAAKSGVPIRNAMSQPYILFDCSEEEELWSADNADFTFRQVQRATISDGCATIVASALLKHEDDPTWSVKMTQHQVLPCAARKAHCYRVPTELLQTDVCTHTELGTEACVRKMNFGFQTRLYGNNRGHNNFNNLGAVVDTTSSITTGLRPTDPTFVLTTRPVEWSVIVSPMDISVGGSSSRYTDIFQIGTSTVSRHVNSSLAVWQSQGNLWYTGICDTNGELTEICCLDSCNSHTCPSFEGRFDNCTHSNITGASNITIKSKTSRQSLPTIQRQAEIISVSNDRPPYNVATPNGRSSGGKNLGLDLSVASSITVWVVVAVFTCISLLGLLLLIKSTK